MNGTYPGAPDLATLAGEKDIALADLDNDGDLDAIVAMKENLTLVGLPKLLLLNDGGSFVDFTDKTDFAAFASACRNVVIFDADGDGWLDVLFASTGVLNPVNLATAPNQPRLHRNKGRDATGSWLGLEEVPRSLWLEFHRYAVPVPGDGSPPVILDYMDPAPRFCGVTSGDLDRDGDADLFFVDYMGFLGHRYLVNQSTPGNFRCVDQTDDPNGVLSALSFGELTDSFMGLHSSQVAAFTTGVEMANINPEEAGEQLEVIAFTDNVNGGPRALYFENGAFRSVRFTGGAGQEYAGALVDFNQDGRLDAYLSGTPCDGILVNKPYGTVPPPDFYFGWARPDPDAGITDVFLTSATGGCVNSADLNRDGLPDIGVAVIDVSATACTPNADQGFQVLLNTTPGPLPGQLFTAPGSSSLVIHGRTGDPDPATGPCAVTFTSIQPWNVDLVYDFAFMDLNKDGFQDILMGTCGGFEFWSMKGFESAQNYCEALPNSTGQAADIGWAGTLNLTDNDFTLTVAGAPAGQVAQFIYGPDQANKPFGDGLRCVGGSIQRFATFTTDTQGRGLQVVDFTTAPAGSGSGQINPDESWNFQCFYRDSGSTGAGFNYSDALSAYFSN